MIYEIAGLRVKIENRYDFTTKYCQEYLSEDQTSTVDITASVTDEEFAAEKALSDEFSDGYIENICLYRSICRQIPVLGRMLLHGAVLEYDGKAYAFLGRSGTGKSTHTDLWLRVFGDRARIVNGDKPIFRLVGGQWHVFGTPWRGKEGLGGNISAPLKGICFLERAKENEIAPLDDAAAVSRLFSQVLMPNDLIAAEKQLELLDSLISKTPTYLLRCNMLPEAAIVSHGAMSKGEIKSDTQ